MRAIRRLRNFIRYLPDEWTQHLGYTRAPDFDMENTREVTTGDLKRMHPGLFVEN